ncbi:MAG: diguanylate cyclase [Terracidiphilus sp.]
MHASKIIWPNQLWIRQLVLAGALLVPQTAWAGLPRSPSPVTDVLRDTYTSLEGLPQSTVEAVSRTGDGFLWVGTQDGMARFDGNRFKVFNPQNTQGLTQSHIRALSAARDGSLWIGTQSRGVVHLVKDKFISYSVADGLLNPFVRCILEDRQGEIWFGTMGGLARWRDGKFDGFTTREGLADNNVMALAEDSQGRIWVGTASGLSLLDHGRFVVFPDQKRFAGQPVTALAVDHENHVWAGGDRKLGQFDAERIVNWYGPGGQPMPVSVDKLAVDSTGAIWIGTGSDGLLRLRDGRLEKYGAAEGLSDVVILALFADSEGNLWAGTNAGGLNRLRTRRISMLGAPEGLSGRDALAVFEARDASLWIAVPGHGVNHVKDGIIRNYTTRDGLTSNEVYCLWQSPHDGTIWVGTKDGSLQWSDGGRFHKVQVPDHGSIIGIFEDHAGNMWLGTRRGLVQIRDGQVVRTYTKEDGLANSAVFAITEALDGSLWLGTLGGLSHFQNGKFINYSASSAGGTLVSSIYADPGGVVWFTTTGDGLGRWQNGKLSWATTRNGLLDDALYSAVEDGAENLWISSNRGIFRIAKRELNNLAIGGTDSLTTRVFDMGDGLRSNECYGGSQPAGWRRRNGDVLFACIGGVVMLNPAQLSSSSGPPPVSIDEARINDKAVPRDALAKTLRISPGAGSLEFTYTGIDFAAPRQMRFRYRLENFDKNWVDAGTRRSAYYTNIPPGTYRFQVMAQNADGVMSSGAASLSFVLVPRFYQTVYFYCAAALLLIILGLVIYELRTRQIAVHEKQLLELVDQRTAALQIEIAERRQTEIELQAARQVAEYAHAEAEYRASHDFLSGIYSRGAIIELLDREASRCQREGQPMSVLLADIDHFKAINDTYGHLVGDQVIKQIAPRIAAALRAYDSIGRFGGEEFLIVAPNCTSSEAVAVAERVRASVASQPFLVADLYIPVSLSVGVSTKTEDVQTVTWTLRAADEAMYKAKRNGRNRIERSTSLDHAALSSVPLKAS